MFKQKRLTFLSIAVLLCLVVGGGPPSAALADDGAPPEPPAEGQTVDPPSGGADSSGAATTDAAVTSDAPVVDAAAPELADAAPATDATPSQETVAEITQALSDADAVLVDDAGNSIALGSMQAAELLTSGDPWFDDGTGTIVRFAAQGGCGAADLCTESVTPIQSAINAAAPGTTIHIDAGTYTEQITIAKSLSLAGAGAGLSTIQAPASLTADAKGQRSLVTITGSGVSVDFSGFTLSGPNSLLDFGIFVGGGATANIHDNTITAVRDQPFSGVQHGVAIGVGRQSKSEVGTATIHNNTIQDYQKTGIAVSGTGSSATISGNTVTGHGPTGVTAQNGIQMSDGATGAIDGNTVTGNYYTGSGWGASGILVLGAGNGVQVSNNTLTGNYYNVIQQSNNATISNNTVTGSDYGLYVLLSNNATVSNNTITGSAASNLYVADSNNSTISNNTFTNSTYDNVDLDTVNGVTFTGNTVSGAGYDGVWLYNATNVDFDGNKFSNNGNGSVAASDPGAGAIHLATGANPASITVTGNNSFSGNKNGVSNESNLAGFVDATNNWWGCATGPGTAGCDTVFGNVTYIPFLTVDPFAPAAGGGDDTGGAGHTTGLAPFVPPLNPGTTPLTLADLPGEVPAGQAFVTGLTLNPIIPVTGAATTGSVQLYFDVPAGSAGPFVVLFWNGTAWVEVPSTIENGMIVFTAATPGDYVLVSP